MTTQISGEIIPSDKPGTLAMAIRQPAGVLPRHRAMERTRHSRHSRRRDADRLRQHRRAQSIRDVPRHTPADRPGAGRGRTAQGRDQCRHQRSKGRRRIVEALVAHPSVKRVNFTGSTKVGRIIAELADGT